MKKVFIHIGYPKTGTTAIQRVCHRNRSLLKRNGVLYPLAGLNRHSHSCLASTIMEPEYRDWAPAGDASLWPKFHDEARRSRCGSVLISSENFIAMKRLDQLAEYLGRDYRVEIVVFLREQSEWIESYFTQLYRQDRKFKDIRAVLASPTARAEMNYEVTLARWEKVFGADAVHVVPYAGSSGRKGMFARFLGLIGVQSPELCDKMASMRINEALPPVYVELMHRLCLTGENFLFQSLREYGETYAAEVVGKFPRYGWLTDAERRDIRERFRRSNAAVARKYLGAEVLFDDEALQVDREAYPEVTEAEIAELERWLLTRLFRQVRTLRKGPVVNAYERAVEWAKALISSRKTPSDTPASRPPDGSSGDRG